MEFFGITLCGPQNYLKDVLKEGYREPVSEADVKEIMVKLSRSSESVSQRGELNGFAYGCFQRFLTMKRKGVIKPLNPYDMYRFPPTSSNEFGWWQFDNSLKGQNWYEVLPRHPQPVSPNSLILDIVRKNNKYATLF